MRIESGKFKGKKLHSPSKKAITRPVTGSVKKSMFSTIAPWLEGAMVIDLYCGTGTMGLEALSRGADYCCFAEFDKGVVRNLQRNIVEVHAEDIAKVWVGDVTVRLWGWLGVMDRKVDVAFVDPPYAHVRKWDWGLIERQLFEPLAAHLSNDGIVVFRAPDAVEIPDKLSGLVKKRQKKYGQMLVAYFQHEKIVSE